ncbi:PAS domain-containing hybrid sensor histidine kinase/response regulator [Phyllobacterium myrsinacearum]|uniref:histidine kinase n=1 Tax=Phyllobacterium myrsinacearum TaxID=28101 RepID=A0A839EE22_9HYPH|nr:PAS domain-containing hybrid sensor histidine kinase/response regulator [Phyllobacterium myrsinacearum]MBA8877172.1 signal transduction histidine kinase/Na+/proline symporter [Phyllobacterium myrsinacearum]
MVGWTGALVALLYLLAQYILIKTVDRRARTENGPDRPYIYALSLASGGSSWLFYGALGYAADNGFEFIGLFIGIALAFTLGFPFLRKIVRLAKSEGITSIADLIGARYGKSFSVTALVTLIATVGLVPYLALQITAIHYLFDVFRNTFASHGQGEHHGSHWLLWCLLCVIGLFTVRNSEKSVHTTDHDEGLVRVSANDSVFKIIVFVIVGMTAITLFFTEPVEHISQIAIPWPQGRISLENMIALILIGASTTVLLPSHFYLTVVENRSERELRTARWLVPACLFIAGVFVLPVTAIGLQVLPSTAYPDFYFLSLPLLMDHDWLSAVAFAGGLSAASTMLVLPAIVLSIMISNDLVMPVVLKWPRRAAAQDFTRTISKVRRYSILVILLAAYVYQFTIMEHVDFSELSLISAVSMMQMLPPFLGGFVWRQATGRGALWGMTAGITVWLYTMVLPTWLDQSSSLIANGPFGVGGLRPHHLWNLQSSSFVNGLLWSLIANLAFFIVGSLSKSARPLERIQANVFISHKPAATVSIRNLRPKITIRQLKEAISRYIGAERAELAFRTFCEREGVELDRDDPADFKTVHFCEQLLSGIVGSPSARLILSLALGPTGIAQKRAQILLDHATGALVQNRYLLQTALDQMDQGIGVFDEHARLTCWNRQFPFMLDLPENLQRMGVSLRHIASFLTDRGDLVQLEDKDCHPEFDPLAAHWRVRFRDTGQIIDVLSNTMPDGGRVTTFTDITKAVETDRMLRQTNEYLDTRVRERTAELTLANQELAKAQRRAEDANISKTRFLTDAGHDILQPLNAARLYSSALSGHLSETHQKELAVSLDSSLEAVESIFNALLDISRLDAGALQPVISTFSLNTVLQQVVRDFLPASLEKGLELKLVDSSVVVETDRNLLRRLLQNLVSNAVKYCRSGKILVGVRHQGNMLEVQILDTGIGIPQSELNVVFREFSRLSEGMNESDGLGLGLSIVERIAKTLGMQIGVTSNVGKGSVFSVRMPVSQLPTLTHVNGVPSIGDSSVADGLSVLCIDDDKRSLSAMKELLQSWGCTVDALSQGKALRRLCQNRTEPPDLILADYNLGDETGLDLIAYVRDHYDCSIRAALVTAERSSQLRNRAAADDVSVINKPVRPAILRAVLSHSQAGESNERR